MKLRGTDWHSSRVKRNELLYKSENKSPTQLEVPPSIFSTGDIKPKISLRKKKNKRHLKGFGSTAPRLFGLLQQQEEVLPGPGQYEEFKKPHKFERVRALPPLRIAEKPKLNTFSNIGPGCYNPFNTEIRRQVHHFPFAATEARFPHYSIKEQEKEQVFIHQAIFM